MTPARIHCPRCRMSFVVRLPYHPNRQGRTAVSWTRCAEAGCGRRFWHGSQSAGAPVVCGVDPNETEHRLPAGERGLPLRQAAPAPHGAVDLPNLVAAEAK